MGFINEYVSDDEVEKYNLDDLWFKYHPGKTSIPSGFQHHWTVDHDNDVFLKEMKIGKEEFSNRITFILYLRESLFEIELDIADGSSLKISEQPYIKLWNFVRISPQPPTDENKNVVDMLKDALTTYGDSGIIYQVPNTIVKFTNI